MRAVPYFPQANEHVCGPATVQMALAAFGKHVAQESLDQELETPRDPDQGTDPHAIVRVLGAHGLSAEAISPASLQDIKNALDKDMVVLVCYSEPELDMGHYSIVQDITDTEIVLHDPYHGPYFTISREEFERRWQDLMFTHTTRWMARVYENPPQK